MLQYLKKVYNKFDRWVHSKAGQRFYFFNDMAHSILIFGIMWPTGLLSWLGNHGGKSLVVLLVASGLYALYNAQKYYSRNYRY